MEKEVLHQAIWLPTHHSLHSSRHSDIASGGGEQDEAQGREHKQELLTHNFDNFAGLNV